MNIETVTKDIEHWIETFVEVPHPALGGWPPCPYARSARLKKSWTVYLGTDPYFDLKNRARWGMEDREVIVYAYDPAEFSHSQFSAAISGANQEFLLAKDILALEDHPADAEIVRGVAMNQGTYALALVQSLSDLNRRARLVADRGFYHGWPEDYLQQLFQHREDPRL